MSTSIVRLWWFGLLGVFWLPALAQAQVQTRPIQMRDVHFDIRFEVRTGPSIVRPKAPWYAYFPADPRMLPAPQTTPFPSWPSVFPPPTPMPPAVVPKQAPPVMGMNVPSGPQMSLYWQTQSTPGMQMQPVGYVPAQPPSYWYRSP